MNGAPTSRWNTLQRALAGVVLALLAPLALAATTTSKATGNWSSSGTWTNGVPGINDDVVIASGHTVTLDVDSAKLATLTVNSGGTLTGSILNILSPKTLWVGKAGGTDVTNNGTITFAAGSFIPLGYVALNKSSTWTGSGTWTLYSIDLGGNALAFAGGTTATVRVAATTPFTTMGTITTPTTVTWEFNGTNVFTAQQVPIAGITYGGITVSGAGSKSVGDGQNTLTINGDLTIGAGVTWNATQGNPDPSVVLKGNFSNSGTFTSGTGTYTFSGSSAQTLTSTSALGFTNLVLNNAAGLTVSASTTVSGVLTLTSGVLTTSGIGVEVIAGASCASSVSRTAGWVAGNLRKTIPTGSPSCSFELGDASTYRPITALSFASVTSSFTVTASVSQAGGKHPSLLSSVLSLSKGVNRYWTLTNNGGGAFTTYSAVFNFAAADVDSGAATGSFAVAKYNAPNWTKPTVGNRTATSTQVLGLSSFSDFSVGENPTAGPDHYELSLDSGSVACEPTSVVVTACADTSNPCSNPSTNLSGAQATLSASAGTLAASPVTFDATGKASTTLSFLNANNNQSVAITLSGETVAASNARRCCPTGAVSCSVSNSCSTTFNTLGFLVTDNAGNTVTIPTQIGGVTSPTTYYLRAVQNNGSKTACANYLFAGNPVSVTWSVVCSNPNFCSAATPMQVTPDGGANFYPVAGNTRVGLPATTNVPMTFTNGYAPFNFRYDDVGQVTLFARKTVSPTQRLSGQSDPIIVKPFGFSVQAIQQTAAPNLANPGGSAATDSKFVAAGESFGLTVTALLSGGGTALNYGIETPREGVLLTPNLVTPAGGTLGTLANATVINAAAPAAATVWVNGVATVTNLSYSEVGSITLTAKVADDDYLGGGSVTPVTTGTIGRFVPAKFALTTGALTHRTSQACNPASSFSYMGENFSVGFTLTAQSLSGTTTVNYGGSFARLNVGNAGNLNVAGLSGNTAFSVANGGLALGSLSGSWSNGIAPLTLTMQAARPGTPSGPFNDLALGIAPVDSDGVALGSFDMSSTSSGSLDRGTIGTAAVFYGRLRLSNITGAADRGLTVPVAAQYWDASTSSWKAQTLDSCTTVATSAVNVGNLRQPLLAAPAVLASSGSTAFTLAGGVGGVRLAAPAGGTRGTLDVALSLGATAADASCLQSWAPVTAASAGASLSHLRGNWCGASLDKDPAARVTFGLPRPQEMFLHRRESW